MAHAAAYWIDFRNQSAGYMSWYQTVLGLLSVPSFIFLHGISNFLHFIFKEFNKIITTGVSFWSQLLCLQLEIFGISVELFGCRQIALYPASQEAFCHLFCYPPETSHPENRNRHRRWVLPCYLIGVTDGWMYLEMTRNPRGLQKAKPIHGMALCLHIASRSGVGNHWHVCH